MAAESENIRKAVWLMLIEPSFKDEIRAGRANEAASKHGVELSDDEARRLEQLDPQDLDDLLQRVDRDMSVIMGGSRPRTQLSLTEDTIAELRKALDRVD